MTQEMWREIERLYHSARVHGLSVLEGCHPELCEQVERLLAQDSNGHFLDLPVRDLFEDLSAPSAAPSVVGRTISHYEIVELLGAGGMGVVYKARDIKLNRLVALKFLPAELRHDPELRRRLAAEARAASALDHPNIVVIYEIHDASDEFFIAMAYHGRLTLRDRLTGPMPVQEAVRIALQIAAGLAKAHALGVVHRDIKPSNIVVAEDGVVRIIDFGLARFSGTTESVPEYRFGTPLYMSPEQASGEALDCRTDLWSLGVVLHQMLSGSPPFRGDGALAVTRAITNDKPECLRGVPPAVAAVVSRALEKNPGRRYQSAAEMEADLASVLGSRPRALYRPDRRYRARAAAALAVLAAMAAVWYHQSRPPAAPPAREPVVLADTLNTAGDLSLDTRTLRETLAQQLSPALSILSEEQIADTLAMMRKPRNTSLAPEIAREVCARTSSKAVIESTVAKLGTGYFLHLRAIDCETGDVLKEEQQRPARSEDVVTVLDRMAYRFRTGARVALTSVAPPPRLQAATTTSLEALKSYSAAFEIAQKKGFAEGMPLVQRAVELDPEFAMAWSYLGRLYADMGESVRAEAAMRKAYALRARVSDRENFFLTYNYQRQIARNLELGRQTLEAWAEKYPHDPFPFSFLSGFTAVGTGKYEKCIEAAKRSLELKPNGVAYVNLADCYIRTSRLDEAEATIRRAREESRAIPELYLLTYLIPFLRGDEKGMDQAARERAHETEGQGWFLYQEASMLAHRGRLRDARSLHAQSISLAEQSRLGERAALFRGGLAVWEALMEDREQAKQDAFAALKAFRGRDSDYGPAFALALAGEPERALAIARELRGQFPEDTSVQFKYVPAIEAMAALQRSAPLDAIDLTLRAAPYDLAQTGVSLFAYYGTMDPVYVRGLAYARAGQHAAAAGEFQKIVDHPGVMLTDLVGALARLQLARAQNSMGEKTKAKASYEQVLGLWKNADSNLPVLTAAKAELARLQ